MSWCFTLFLLRLMVYRATLFWLRLIVCWATKAIGRVCSSVQAPQVKNDVLIQ